MEKNYMTTLQDFLHSINIIGRDMDVYVDGIDGIAVCPPVKLTPEGRKYFAQALNAGVVVVYKDDAHEDTYVSDPKDERVDQKAWELLCSLAGYCPDSKHQKWFEGEAAEMI